MITGIRRFFRKIFFTDWQHVGIFEVESFRYDFENWKLYIHCFESQHGDRKIEIVGAQDQQKGAKSYTSGLGDKFRITKLYQTELYPWLCGRVHGRIPGYEIVKSQKFDFTKKLKGETPIILNDDEKS